MPLQINSYLTNSGKNEARTELYEYIKYLYILRGHGSVFTITEVLSGKIHLSKDSIYLGPRWGHQRGTVKTFSGQSLTKNYDCRQYMNS